MSDTQQGPDWWLASDGKWYPPQQPQGAAPPFQQPQFSKAPKSGPNGCLIALAIVGGLVVLLVVVSIIGVVAGSSSDDTDGLSGTEDHPADEDVELTDCSRDEFGFFSAEFEVTNHSSDPSTYLIDVTFETPDGSRQLGDGIANVSELRNGQSATVEASSIDEAPQGQRFECIIADVSRFAS